MSPAKVLRWLIEDKNMPQRGTETYPKWCRNLDYLKGLKLDDPETFYAVKGHDLDELLLALDNVAILTSHTPSISQKFKLIKSLASIPKTRESNQGEEFYPIAFAIDEAHVYCPHIKGSHFPTEAVNIFRRTRSVNISVILTGHSVAYFDPFLLSNLSMIVNVGATSLEDIRILANIMGLTKEQIERSKVLTINEAIVKVGSLPPQLVTFPDQHCAKTDVRELLRTTLRSIHRIEPPAIEKPKEKQETTRNFLYPNGLQKQDIDILIARAEAESLLAKLKKECSELMEQIQVRCAYEFFTRIWDNRFSDSKMKQPKRTKFHRKA